uniref:ATPase inhibitor, mitochondrial n=1 Tax=Cyprinus carpio TaxID=7962 RepID=A0A8C1ZGX3_CYPCA
MVGSCFEPTRDRSARLCHCTHERLKRMARFLNRNIRTVLTTQIRMSSDQLGELGKGAGKGGGGGGAVREAGGAFGRKQAAEEEMYFKRKEQEQLAALRRHHQEEIDHHQKEIERLQHEISRHEGKIRKLKKDD